MIIKLWMYYYYCLWLSMSMYTYIYIYTYTVMITMSSWTCCLIHDNSCLLKTMTLVIGDTWTKNTTQGLHSMLMRLPMHNMDPQIWRWGTVQMAPLHSSLFAFKHAFSGLYNSKPYALYLNYSMFTENQYLDGPWS